MNIETIQLVLTTINMIGTGAVYLYVHIQSRQRVTEDRLRRLADDIDDRLDGHGQRLAKLEQARQGEVNHDHLAELWQAFRSTQALLSEIKGKQDTFHDMLKELIRRQWGGQ